MTGVIVRSAANVQAGGKTRLSAILHGIWLLLFTWALTPLLRMIPTAALAGILVYTGFRLIDFKGFRHLWRTNRGDAFIFLITLLLIIVEDLLIGVVTGIVLSAARLLFQFSRLDVIESSSSESVPGSEKTVLTLSGAATFLRLPKLAGRLEKVPAGAELHVNLSQLDYIDHACLELIINWAKQHSATGGRLVMDWESLHARFQQSGK
jgi:MFS superfamily sulfate permease-like transporter